MIRILHVFGRLDMGGAESRIMDLYRNIDREKVQFDFVEHTEDKCFFEDEILGLGGRIFRVPRFNMVNINEYKRAFEELFRSHMEEDGSSEFAMVQGHITSSASIYLPIAKRYGVGATIAHARSAGVDPGIKGRITRFLRRNLYKKADYLFTCSKVAGISVFGLKAVEEGKTVFVPNAIDCSKFAFNDTVRKEIREKLDIDDCLVFGHVGRFHYAKNHEYLLRLFRDFLEDWNANPQIAASDYKYIRPVLILLGEGPLMGQTKALAIELDITDNVMFLGNQQEVYNYYQAMDIFVYPSRYEGLPGTVVEAQATGLPVYMSSNICEEVVVSDLVKSLSITLNSQEWSGVILDDILKEKVPNWNRNAYNEIISKAGFDVKEQAKILENFYCGRKEELNHNLRENTKK